MTATLSSIAKDLYAQANLSRDSASFNIRIIPRNPCLNKREDQGEAFGLNIL